MAASVLPPEPLPLDSPGAQSSTADALSPADFELLILCCRSRVESGQIDSLMSVVDWSRVLQHADRHGLVPVLYERLATHSSALSIWPELKQLFQINARRALWLTHVLEKVLAALADRGIAALPYKGPVLAQLLYGDIALRQYTDLDILIRPNAIKQAKSALAEIGLIPHIDLTPPEEKAYLASGYEYAFDGFGNHNLVELQWRILPSFYAVDFDMDGFFQRARPLALAGTEVRTLRPEDLFLVLCVHAAKHLWAKLSWIYEIARLSQFEVNWSEVSAAATQLGIQRIVGVSLRLAADLFLSRIPQAFDHMLQDGEVACIAAQLIQTLSVAEPPDTKSPTYFRRMIGLRERRSDQARIFFRLATTPSLGDLQAIRLPAPLLPGYRFVRLVRLATRY